MRLLLRLAFRNLLRNKRRSILTLMAVLIPVLILDLMWGFSGAFERSLFDNTVKLETGHIQIHPADYRSKTTGEAYPIMWDTGPITNALSRDPDIEWFTLKLELPALAANQDRSKPIMIQGVEPEESTKISPVDNWVKEGRYLKADDSNKAVAGKLLLENLKVESGQSIILLVSHPQIGSSVLVPKIVGELDAPSSELNRSLLQITLKDARQLIKSSTAATTAVAMVKGVTGPWDSAKIDQVANRLQSKLGEEFLVETWKELAPQRAGILRILRPLYAVFAAIFYLLAGLVVLNTLYLSVLERIRELGVVSALGASKRRIMGMISTEALLLTIIGAAVGTGIGVGLVLWGSQGLALPVYQEYQEELSAVGFQSVMYLRITTFDMVISAVTMMFIALVAAWWPARQAAGLDPVEAMRYE